MTRFVRREFIGEVVLNKNAGTNATAGVEHVGDYNYKSTVKYVNPTTGLVGDDKYNIDGAILINPGNYLMCPWLAQVANFYEEYKLNSLMVEYEPLMAEGNATTAQVGSVMICYQANANAPALATKSEFLEHADSISQKTTLPIVFSVPFSSPYKAYFTSGFTTTAAVTKNATIGTVDCKTLFPGKLTIATQGLLKPTDASASPLAGQVLGNLYISYDVTLLKEKYVGDFVPIGGRTVV